MLWTETKWKPKRTTTTVATSKKKYRIHFKQGERSTPNLFNILYYYFGTQYPPSIYILHIKFTMHIPIECTLLLRMQKSYSVNAHDKVRQRSSTWCFSIDYVPLFLLLLIKMHFFFVFYLHLSFVQRRKVQKLSSDQT